MTKATPIAEFLTNSFLKWQMQEGDKRTVTDYAAYLGVSRDTLNKWMNGTRKPTGLYVEQVASRLGDEVYTVLGLTVPERDTRLKDLERVWDSLPEGRRNEIMALAFSVDESATIRPTAPPVVKAPRKRAG